MATLRSSRDMYKHTDYLIEDSAYRVVSGGLWRDPEWKFSNDLGPGLQEIIQPENIFPHESIVDRLRELSNEHERVRENLDRRIVLHTGPEGMRQFQIALQEEAGRFRSLGEIFNRTAPLTTTSDQGTIQVYGTGGVDPYEEGNEIIFENPRSQPSFTNFDRNIPGNLVMPDAFIGYSSVGEYIANTDSITTTRQFNTEEEAINYLDQLSSNDI